MSTLDSAGKMALTLTVGGLDYWKGPRIILRPGRPQIMVTSTLGQLTAPLSTYPQLLSGKRPSQPEVKSIGQETPMLFL